MMSDKGLNLPPTSVSLILTPAFGFQANLLACFGGPVRGLLLILPFCIRMNNEVFLNLEGKFNLAPVLLLMCKIGT